MPRHRLISPGAERALSRRGLMMWMNPRNAVAFAAEIAELAIIRWRDELRDEIYDVVTMQLRANRAFELSSDDDDVLDRYCRFQESETGKSYRLFRARWGDGHSVRAVFKLVDDVGHAWQRPEGCINAVYRHAARTGLRLDLVQGAEMSYRFRDQDPEGVLDEDHRLAFEAAWLAGNRRFAVKLLHSKLLEQTV